MDNYVSVSFPALVSSKRTQDSKTTARTTEAAQTPLLNEDIEEIDSIVRLHTVGRLLCTLTEKHVEFLCQEVKTISEGRASLHLGALIDPSPHIFSVFLLQFNGFKYGYLSLKRDETHPDQPAIPLLTAHIMVQALSCILHMLNQHLFLQSFGKVRYQWTTITLTKREQHVLSLLCQGYTQEEMGELLNVSYPTINTHCQHIYEQLEVHNGYEARIAAFNHGLYSFLNVGDDTGKFTR